jgi:secreted trypsin-like serine protease
VKFRIAALGFISSLIGACSVGVTDDASVAEDGAGEQSADIVRGETERHLPQVVAVVVQAYSGTTLCSGTYFDSRMVVTAAHCVPDNAIPGQTFVYFGKHYDKDKAVLPNIPRPGKRSDWARV